MLAGVMARPRAISLRTSSGSIFSRLATKVISSVVTPLRARCICDMFLLPLAAADSVSRFSIQLSRNAIEPPVAQLIRTSRCGQTSLLRVENKVWHRGRLTATEGKRKGSALESWQLQGKACSRDEREEEWFLFCSEQKSQAESEADEDFR